MTTTKHTPRLDWRGLRRYLKSVKVLSCADGSFMVEAKWQKMYAPCGGVFTRTVLATRLQALLNARLKGFRSVGE